ncbi:Polysaccharide export protein [uncultured Woeseiaceae bacterium]|uniref:Polysaccharide export protein n=1 Tax=uncultured Woeseiaceae bacterium TaxID=1983305 RepID=A0A7D9D3Z9_9GAMM|nr:Polysaccharide export protein [uncultured Woeseiaceae bacterium]
MGGAKIFRLTTLIVAALVLHGCVLAPGMTAQNTVTAEVETGRVVRIVSITTDLLNQMDVDHKAQARQVASEFSKPWGAYRVGPGDVLQVTVWDHPELTIPAGSFRDPQSSGQQVGDDGTLYYPYVGVIQAVGMTVPELRTVLTARLSAYIQNPQLDVRVVAYRSQKVYVVGEVARAGVLPLDDLPMMVADAINLAGGLTEAAYKSGVNISRDGKVYEIDLRALYDFADASQNLMLQHGDIVNVLDRSQQRVFVLGEVTRPSSVEIVNGQLTLSATLGDVGGVNQRTSDPSKIFVIRGSDGDNPKIFHLDAKQAYGLLLAERFEMQAQDVVFVDTAGVSRWNRVISQLLPSISVIGILDNVAQ